MWDVLVSCKVGEQVAPVPAVTLSRLLRGVFLADLYLSSLLFASGVIAALPLRDVAALC